ncbi:hypothetical protein V8G54_033896 [Vigna mungo]|uniref:Uncharacterized protein n=1 Tax=Vigna mungo TaxID=3915 RepID=A0AAQ3MPW2_VIGMU
MLTNALTEARSGQFALNGQVKKALLHLRPTFGSDIFGHKLETSESASGTRLGPIDPVELLGGGHSLELLRHLPEPHRKRGGPLLEAGGEEGGLGVSASDVLDRNDVVADVERYLHQLLLVLEPGALLAALLVGDQWAAHGPAEAHSGAPAPGAPRLRP